MTEVAAGSGLHPDTLAGNWIADRTITIAEWAGKQLANTALPDFLREPLTKLHNDHSFQSEFVKSVMRAAAMSAFDAPKFLMERLGISAEKAAAAEGLINDFVNHTLRKLLEHAGDKPAKKGAKHMTTSPISGNPVASASEETFALAYKVSDTGPMVTHYHQHDSCPRMQREQGYRWHEVTTATKPPQQNSQKGRGNNQQQQLEPVEIKTLMKPMVTKVRIMDAARDMDSTGAKACHACGADELIRMAIAGHLEQSEEKAPAHPQGFEPRGSAEPFRAFVIRLSGKVHDSLPPGKDEAFSDEMEEFLRTSTAPGDMSPMELLECYAEHAGGLTEVDLKLLFELPAHPVLSPRINRSAVEAFERAVVEAKSQLAANPDKLMLLTYNVNELQQTPAKLTMLEQAVSQLKLDSAAQVVALFVEATPADRTKVIGSASMTRITKFDAAKQRHPEELAKWEASRTALRVSRANLLTEAATKHMAEKKRKADKEHAEHLAHEAKVKAEKIAAVEHVRAFAQKNLGLSEAETRGDFSRTESALPWA